MAITSEAQKRASKKWRDANKEKVKAIRDNWVENNRDYVNETTRIRQQIYYHRDKEFNVFLRILLD